MEGEKSRRERKANKIVLTLPASARFDSPRFRRFQVSYGLDWLADNQSVFVKRLAGPSRVF